MTTTNGQVQGGARTCARAGRRRAGAWRRVVAAVALACAAACGGGSAGDQTTKLTGPWTFTSGTLTPTCLGGVVVPPFTLVGLTVVFAKVDDSTISLTAGQAGCTVKFKVSGDEATAQPMQTCTLDVGGALMTQIIGINAWTLKLDGDDRLDSDIMGTAAVCSVSGTGVLTRGAPDAGTDAAEAPSDAPSTETPPDAPSDTPPDTSTAETATD